MQLDVLNKTPICIVCIEAHPWSEQAIASLTFSLVIYDQNKWSNLELNSLELSIYSKRLFVLYMLLDVLNKTPICIVCIEARPWSEQRLFVLYMQLDVLNKTPICIEARPWSEQAIAS